MTLNRPPSNFYAPSATYEYDFLNRLTAAVTYVQSSDTARPGSKAMQRVEFTYDQQDRRVETDELSGAPIWGHDYDPQTQTYGAYYWQPVSTQTKNTRTIYSGMMPIQERSGSVTQVQLFWGDNGLIARRVKNGTGWRDYFVTTDTYGSVCQLIRADTGTVVARYNYDSFGVVTKRNGIAAPADQLDTDQVNQQYRFQSHWRDTTSGLSDFGFRFYSPGTGRFINQDPLEEDGGINLYGFVNGNPTNSVDLHGLAPVCTIDRERYRKKSVLEQAWGAVTWTADGVGMLAEAIVDGAIEMVIPRQPQRPQQPTPNASANADLQKFARSIGKNANSATTQQVFNHLDGTSQAFISKFRKAGILGKFPKEYLNRTLRDSLVEGGTDVNKLIFDRRWIK